jgi:hypothetical protein
VLLPLLVCVAALLAFVGWRIAGNRAAEPVVPVPIERPAVAAEPAVRDAPTREEVASKASVPEATPASETLQWTVRPELRDGGAVAARWSLDVEWTDEHGKRRELRAIACEGPEHTQSGVSAVAYRVRAYTETLGSRWARAVAARAGAAPVKLVLEPASRVEGEVVDSAGTSAAGVEVHLISIQTRQATTATSDANGAFVLTGVVDGEYHVRAGQLDNPLVRPPDLAVKGGRMRIDRIVLPQLFELALRVVDPYGQRLMGASVNGFSQEGGAFALETDGDGAARATQLPAGRYRVFASHTDFGRTNQHVEVPVSGNAVVEIALPHKSAR